MIAMRIFIIIILAIGSLIIQGCTGVCCSYPASGRAPFKGPLPNAHSHNDYEQQFPLMQALNQGFCSVEVDVHLVNGRLLVAHDADQVEESRTIESMYMDPLRQRIQKNGGSVYAGYPDVQLQLLIDFKTEGESTYEVLKSSLEPYRDILVSYESGQIRQGAVMAVISGSRPIEKLSGETRRLAFLDGRLENLSDGSAKEIFPLVSADWDDEFEWSGEDQITPEEEKKLRELIEKAHQQGKKLRLWGHPDRPEVWGKLQQMEMDWINTDRIPELAEFLNSRRPGN